jgi:hypothetical protein
LVAWLVAVPPSAPRVDGTDNLPRPDAPHPQARPRPQPEGDARASADLPRRMRRVLPGGAGGVVPPPWDPWAQLPRLTVARGPRRRSSVRASPVSCYASNAMASPTASRTVLVT